MPAPSRAGAIRWDRVARLLVILGLALIGVLYVHPLLSIWSAKGEAAKRSGDVARLSADQKRLDARVRALKSPRALEREARALGMIRPGERAYVIKGLPGG